jgi:hypothetical protein
MGNVNILKELKKISNNLIDDPAPQILFKYLKGANAFHYGLGKGLGVFVKTQEETTQDKQLINSIIPSILKFGLLLYFVVYFPHSKFLHLDHSLHHYEIHLPLFYHQDK